jgi:polynucleotide 5'-hydroxyl-kinase GRC3/NOL9
MDIIPSPEWESVSEALLNKKGTGIIIGSTDSGKSTFARFLIGKLLMQNLSVCLVDSDIGQSALGLPGTVSMKCFCLPDDLQNFVFEKMSFIGVVNPAKSIPSVIESTKRMSKFCAENAEVTLIDTSGLISGEPGKLLKAGKIRAIQPDYIFALQRSDELEHILALFVNMNIFRIRTSEEVKTRTIAHRTAYRKNKFMEYFNRSPMNEFLLHSGEVQYFYHNKQVALKGFPLQEGSLIGLNHDEATMALRIIEEPTDMSIVFRAPLPAIRHINKVILGDLTMP